MGHLSYQCDKLLGDKEVITFLQRERYDITILDAFNPCSFILAHKLGTSVLPIPRHLRYVLIAVVLVDAIYKVFLFYIYQQL